jgi:hypothetical protein
MPTHALSGNGMRTPVAKNGDREPSAATNDT